MMGSLFSYDSETGVSWALNGLTDLIISGFGKAVAVAVVVFVAFKVWDVIKSILMARAWNRDIDNGDSSQDKLNFWGN